MKKRLISWGIVVFILILCGLGLLKIKSAKEFPSWIEGTLMISTIGSEELLDTSDLPTDQYICAFDFTNKSIDSLRVPSHARLMKYKDNTVVLYRRNGLYGAGEHANLIGIYRTYSAGCILKKAKDYTIEECPAVEILNDYTFSVNPLVVYGVSGEGDLEFGGTGYRSYCYLSYGVSDDGELEYHLLCEKTTGELTVLRHYPLDYPISHTFVSVSPSGKIAWRELDENDQSAVFVYDGNGILSLQDEQVYTEAICWIDDNRLLYTADIRDWSEYSWGDPVEFVPRIWHLDTGTIEDLNSVWEDNRVVFPSRLSSIAVDKSGRYIAGFISPNYDGSGDIGRIVVFSLIDGNHFIFIPWEQSMPFKDDLFVCYGKDDSGGVFYDPGDFIDAQLVWYD